MKTSERIKSAEELAQETEFYRRLALSNEARRMSTKGSYDVFISFNGVELGSKHETLRRGKVVGVTYILPSMEKYEALMKLPVARSSR